MLMCFCLKMFECEWSVVLYWFVSKVCIVLCDSVFVKVDNNFGVK